MKFFDLSPAEQVAATMRRVYDRGLTTATGGNISMLMVHPSIKQNISATFTGAGTKFNKGETNQLNTAWDVIKTDFGELDVVPNRVMQRTREAYYIDPDLVALAVLRDMQDQELARIGSARNFMIETEYALEVREERGLACTRDIQ